MSYLLISTTKYLLELQILNIGFYDSHAFKTITWPNNMGLSTWNLFTSKPEWSRYTFSDTHARLSLDWIDTQTFNLNFRSIKDT